MSGYLIAGIGVVYLIVSILEFSKGRADMAILFGGYAIAQVGVYMAAR